MDEDRLKHSLSVARKMVEIAKSKNLIEFVGIINNFFNIETETMENTVIPENAHLNKNRKIDVTQFSFNTIVDKNLQHICAISLC